MFELTEDQQALAEAVDMFCADTLAVTAAADDEAEQFRPEYIQQMGEQGFCGIATPEEFGGLGLGYQEYIVVLEAISRYSPAYAVAVAVTGLPQVILNAMGTQEQKEAWLPQLASGEILGAFALSEPDAGSDAGALKTSAVLEGDEYVLNGTKLWITHGGYAGVYIVMARTGGPGPRGVSAFIVPGNASGVSFGKKEVKMGLRASPTLEMILENVRIPASNLIGAEGEGFKVAMKALDSGRITIGATAVGLGQAATDAAAAYGVERKQFGRSIIDFQGVGFMLADMQTAVDSARLMVRRAAWLKDNGRAFSTQAAMAKVVATDMAMKVTTDAVQVFGGNGYTREYPVERMMRDAKVMQIFEGTNQIQRLVISRSLKRNFTRD